MDDKVIIELEPPEQTSAKAHAIALVIALVGKAQADQWWASRNSAFDMQTPAALWLTDYKRVLNYLLTAASRP